MPPNLELRLPCERVMGTVPTCGTNPGPCLSTLMDLNAVLVDKEPQELQRWIEYVSIPYLLLLPSDAEKALKVSERVREECFAGLAVLVGKLPELFAKRRVDLYFPLVLRVLASLTDMDNHGQAMLLLKEETKTKALELLLALFALSNNNEVEFNGSLTLHCAALVLDLSSRTKEKSSEVRMLALQVFGKLIANPTLTSHQEVEFMFPGASSVLCEASMMDFKSRQDVVLVATRTLLGLCQGMGSLSMVISNLFPLLGRIWRNSGQMANVEIVIARTQLAAYVLLHSDLGQDQTVFLLRQMLLACSQQPLQEEDNACLKAFGMVQHLCNASQMLTHSLCETLQDPSLTALELQHELDIAGFLLSTSGHCKNVLVKLELALEELQWSLLFAFSCDSSRVEQSGKLEFYRIADLTQASKLFHTLLISAPSLATQLFDSLLDATANSLLRERESVLGLLIPHSQLPQTLYMLSQLTQPATTRERDLLSALLDLEPLWYDETTDVLVKIAALDCISYCSTTAPLVLVDVLYPVLHSLGDEHSGVKIAAERCLEALAQQSKHSSVTNLLQNNVDYVVDALVKRLPQLLPGDVRFSNVIHALVQRIPVWIKGEETSPWVDDLMITIIQGLNNRTNTPQVVWSLLRIAQVIVDRASQVNGIILGEGTDPMKRIRKSHNEFVNECIGELSVWNKPEEAVDDDDDDDEEAKESDDRPTPHDPFHSILEQCIIFFSDYDVLVRHQAFKVATLCVEALGKRDQIKARQAVHCLWPSMVEQLQQERHPEIVTLLLDSLLIVSSSAAGEEFFASRFTEEAWPVLEAILHRASRSSYRGKPTAFRDIQLAKRVLQVLPKLPTAMLLGSQAERIALSSGWFFSHSELNHEAYKVWHALAECGAGDFIWLPVAMATGRIPKQQPWKEALPERHVAETLWILLLQD
ncbi:hypothetical protein BASA81_001974 [Batrachochytrium salamandrivorans]|nr:hypothetical protein BASA81_001974 [Batrachochytrium salamandrivorans]